MNVYVRAYVVAAKEETGREANKERSDLMCLCAVSNANTRKVIGNLMPNSKFQSLKSIPTNQRRFTLHFFKISDEAINGLLKVPFTDR